MPVQVARFFLLDRRLLLHHGCVRGVVDDLNRLFALLRLLCKERIFMHLVHFVTRVFMAVSLVQLLDRTPFRTSFGPFGASSATK